MKLLMFDSPEFWYRTHSKTLESVEAVDKEHMIDNTVVVFITTFARILRALARRGIAN